ncbi:histidine kinase/DNA gyrase B/HSP90-like ATPase [Lacibacter cauensis]|uniref:histidine kinase n=1 Tax=Lacibacter cauensis TaxID=510947 RepID=A0A562SR96_9BACT|nr:HAMP domain-containing sensor histidine kinase [Lacibacter cauensis]TWI83789.1 histidine kinase/DNA gyrase B/HSP90-like ATPase [Lacibacter cauensis]
MLGQYFNWRTLLALIAILIVTGTIFYSNYLAGKIAVEERLKVEQWVEAGRFLIYAPVDADTKLPSLIRNEQKSIPIIETDEKDSIVSYINIDSTKIAANPQYLQKQLKLFKAQNQPIILEISKEPLLINKYYYGHSTLLQQVKYYPMVQLFIVALFIIITIFSLQIRNKSTQNQVWAGMAKETAHQLGTPVSSLQGWVEMLKEVDGSRQIATEIEKDVQRLRLVSDRFGKIGSTPQLEMHDVVVQVEEMVEYIRKRATGKVLLEVKKNANEMSAKISPPLFDWVIENLLKNALDAMDGKGSITVDMHNEDRNIIIDVTDTGKGIASQNINRVFKPGFTTKKRGWGLGLSLSKRIIEQYHKGQLYVKHSEPGKGTTFRIVLKK